MRALVMELVEGPTLADRIAQGAIPLDEALPIAKQIADALEAAHERGIIHRDLKPANIKVRSDGTVKVLDFGLAKAMEPTGAPSAHATMSPTISLQATMAGVILGTAAYMSPEQARGKTVDRRADIWAFGVVVYEMLTGRRAFDGDDISITLAAVMMKEPDWAALPTGLPRAVSMFLRRCLAKDPRERIRDIGDVRLALEGAFETADLQAAAPAIAPARQAPLWRRVMPFVATGVLSAVIVAAGAWILTRPTPPRVARLTITPAAAAALTLSGADRDLTITPDGTRVLYVGNKGTQLFLRPLDALEPTSLFTGALRGPFVSPDGQWVGVIDGALTLKKVAISGGPAITVATLDGASRGAVWAPDDTILFATGNVTTGLQRVAAAGGSPEVLTRPDHARGEADHLWPELLPGGRAVLFTITALTGGADAAQVAVLDLQTKAQTVLVRGGSHAHYVPGGYLVYAAANTLRAIAFDPATLTTRGTAVPVVPEVVTMANAGVDAALAADGTLAYVAGAGASLAPRTLAWVDRRGQEMPIPAPPRPYQYPRLSPDGSRVVMYSADQDADLWSWDFSRLTLTRMTFTPGFDFYPVWTPDGRRLIFASERAGARNLYWQAADGTSAVERLTTSANLQDATAVSPDGAHLIFMELFPKTGLDILQVELAGAHRVTPLVQSPFNEQNGIVSPDGRWLAYEANDSGQFEIYVRPYPDVNSGHWQVSTGGGTQPLWARNGQELFYTSSDGAIMRVGVERAASWAATTPTPIVKAGYYTIPPGFPGRAYDVAPDGQRFLMIKEGGGTDQGAAAPQIVVVQHFDQELKTKVPTK